MDLLEGMLKKSTINNSKGGEYYKTTYNANLDLFSGVNRYTPTEICVEKFRNAYTENKVLAVANLLYFLDIRNGKGERHVFKSIFPELCKIDEQMAKIVLNQISILGRWDYILQALDTPIEQYAIEIIKKQIVEDTQSETPSLLSKWLPSVRNHNKNNLIAQKICDKLKISEKQYRKILKQNRDKLNLIEKNLTERKYDKIVFSQVPSKAMLKYRNAFEINCEDEYRQYLSEANSGKQKINTSGLFCYEIVEKILQGSINRELANAMWEQQKDVLNGNKSNILVMADTSGSMTWQPHMYETSVGLAIYMAERNHGIFQNYFIRFDTDPYLEKVNGIDIVDKVNNIKCYYGSTDIDKAFKLILNTAVDNSIKSEDMPSHIIIISDMEFDRGCYSDNGTNLEGWKLAFMNKGYELPKIIFWNVSTDGFPATKFDNDVCMINGFSSNVIENILDLENFSPENIMNKVLDKYVKIINKGE